MKRSDEIAEALKTFFEKYECKMDADTKLIYAGAFAVGATWADEHPIDVWHDASEEPQENEYVLIQDDENNYDVTLTQSTDEWDTWCGTCKIIRWAYLKDLLPKQSGNSEQLKGGEK